MRAYCVCLCVCARACERERSLMCLRYCQCYSQFFGVNYQLTVIQGDISELTVDAVVHPTNNSFSLAGQCGELCE